MARARVESGDQGKPSRKSTTSSGRKASSRSGSKATTSAATQAPKTAATQGELLPEGKLYYRIGEVAKITGVKPHVLRYWETEFRWMSPPKSRSKQRLYRRKDIEMITVIKRLLYEERYTIAGARQRLRELGLAKAREGAGEEAEGTSGKGAKASQRAHESPLSRLREELEQIRAVLAEPIG